MSLSGRPSAGGRPRAWEFCSQILSIPARPSARARPGSRRFCTHILPTSCAVCDTLTTYPLILHPDLAYHKADRPIAMACPHTGELRGQILPIPAQPFARARRRAYFGRHLAKARRRIRQFRGRISPIPWRPLAKARGHRRRYCGQILSISARSFGARPQNRPSFRGRNCPVQVPPPLPQPGIPSTQLTPARPASRSVEAPLKRQD